MRIMIVAPEANPFARSGGLAEAIHGLATALVRQDSQVTVVIPFYRQVQESGQSITFTGKTLNIPLSIKTLPAEIYYVHYRPHLEFFFIGQDSLFNRDGIYGTAFGEYEDNAERFIFFSRAVPEMIQALDLDIDVCHCHEWQTGLVPAYLRTLYRDWPRLAPVATLYTVHNVGYQGIFSHYDMALTGLGWEFFTPQALEFYGKINLMKSGLVFADLLSTVSETYRNEILSPEFGFGLEGVFQERAADLYGVLDGVDYDVWDPSRDIFIASSYSRENLAGKKICKADLASYFGLELSTDQPLIGMTTRLVNRKGIDLIQDSVAEMMALGVALVLHGTGEERYQYFFGELPNRYPGRVGVQIGYSEKVAHKIIAGSDIFLMPSRYEPCGLDQLYCLRYGTVPIVRATGGLDETIREYNPETGHGAGFKFTDYTPAALLHTVQRALLFYRNHSAWEQLIREAMRQNFSWDTAAQKYLELYQKALDKRLTHKES